MNPIEINLDSTALGSSACILKLIRTIVGEVETPELGGYREKKMDASIVYGIAVHKFTDTMFKTGGNMALARTEANKAFDLPKFYKRTDDGWLGDPNHLLITCLSLWNDYLAEDSTFSILQIPNKEGLLVPATEQTFRIKIYEDAFVIIYLCGTMDSLGKFTNGCYAIRDFKTTKFWDKKEYLSSYDLSRQLRLYTLSCKLVARSNPDSTIGRVGASKMGAFIDAIFIKRNPNDNEYGRTIVYQFDQEEIDRFEAMLMSYCKTISEAIQIVRSGQKLPKQGILNGACDGKFGKCAFWQCCKSSEAVSSLLLQRDFVRTNYNPLNFNGL